LTLAQLLQILRARRWLITFTALILAGLACGVSFLLPPTYLAQVSLVAEVKDTDPVTGNAVRSQALTSYLTTQADIIRSRSVALKVVDKLHLDQDRRLQAQFQDITGGVGNLREWLADRLSLNVEVDLARASNVFNIVYSAADGGDAALLANAFAEAYIQTTIELAMDPARRQATWFDDQLLGLRKNLEAAQAKLSKYQKENALVTTDGRLDVETARLAGMTTELVQAQAEASDARTRRDQMKRALVTGRTNELPDVLKNGVVQGMKSDLTRAEGKLAEVAERYGPNHPAYISAAAEVNSLRQRLATELGNAQGSIDQTAEIAEQRAAAMQAALEAQKQKILELGNENDARDVLTREVESAQRTYDAATQRASAVRLESQLDQSTVAVLAPALAPLDPARPRPVLNTVAALLFGLALGLGLAVMGEWRDRRVRTAADITTATGLTVLAEFPPAPKTRGWFGRPLRPAFN
jgi:succinoglycan biosynthesis transport protein ExoP